jgi:hypothetical protein
MKHIIKNINNAPNALTKYRRTPNAAYDGYIDTDESTGEKSVLKKALADEQGWICCYCMNTLKIGEITVEHYIPQSRHEASPYSEQEHRQNELNYINMLASCHTKLRDCSKERGNKPLYKLDPRQAESSERIVKYNTADGSIMAAFDNDSMTQDELDKVLQLNTKELKNARKTVMDEAMKQLQEKKNLRNRTWTKADFDALIAHYSQTYRNKDGNLAYKRFCSAIVFAFERRKQRYP